MSTRATSPLRRGAEARDAAVISDRPVGVGTSTWERANPRGRRRGRAGAGSTPCRDPRPMPRCPGRPQPAARAPRPGHRRAVRSTGCASGAAADAAPDGEPPRRRPYGRPRIPPSGAPHHRPPGRDGRRGCAALHADPAVPPSRSPRGGSVEWTQAARKDPQQRRLGGQLASTPAAARRDDRPPGPGAHTQPEAVGPGPTTVVRLERALALGHGCRSPGEFIVRSLLRLRIVERSRPAPALTASGPAQRADPVGSVGESTQEYPPVGGRLEGESKGQVAAQSKPVFLLLPHPPRHDLPGACFREVLVAAAKAC